MYKPFTALFKTPCPKSSKTFLWSAYWGVSATKFPFSSVWKPSCDLNMSQSVSVQKTPTMKWGLDALFYNTLNVIHDNRIEQSPI